MCTFTGENVSSYISVMYYLLSNTFNNISLQIKLNNTDGQMYCYELLRKEQNREREKERKKQRKKRKKKGDIYVTIVMSQ